uniref:Uncharacterized protein n=1 Tax=Trichobilharzia regenti TaxID=157069 RepID=A0AA85J053_TRIRE|nr:unnamed protein product [Trichobilharzia regenti]
MRLYYPVNHATTRVLTKKRNDTVSTTGGSVGGGGGNKVHHFSNQNMVLQSGPSGTGTLVSRSRQTGTTSGNSSSIVAAAISAAAAAAAMSGAGVVNSPLNGLHNFSGLHSSNSYPGNNLLFAQNNMVSLGNSINTSVAGSLASVAALSTPASTPTAANIASYLKAQQQHQQQQSLVGAATTVALQQQHQQHNPLCNTNDPNAQAILAALTLQNFNVSNPLITSQLLKQPLSGLSFPLDNVISNLPLQTQTHSHQQQQQQQQTQTSLFNSNNNNNHNNSMSTAGTTNLMNTSNNGGINPFALNAATAAAVAAAAATNPNIGTDLLLNSQPGRAYQLLKPTFTNLNPLGSNNLTSLNTSLVGSNLNLSSAAQLGLPLMTNTNVQNLNLLTAASSAAAQTSSSSPSTSIASSIHQTATNFDLNSNEAKLWLATLFGGNSVGVNQSDLRMLNNSPNNNNNNQIYQMYKSNNNLNDSTNALLKTNSVSKTNQAKMNITVQQIHNISNNATTNNNNNNNSNNHNTSGNGNKTNEHTLTQNQSNINTSKSGVLLTHSTNTQDMNSLTNAAAMAAAACCINPLSFGINPLASLSSYTPNSSYINGTGLLTDLFSGTPAQQTTLSANTLVSDMNSTNTNYLSNFWPIIPPSVSGLSLPTPSYASPLIIGNQTLCRQNTSIPRFSTY